MGFEIEKKVCVLLGFMVLFPAICTSQFTPSRATYYGSPDFHGTPRTSNYIFSHVTHFFLFLAHMPFLAFHFDNSCINVGLGGACGFGEFGRTVNDGSVSAASPWLFKSGSGCGACYQVYYYFSYYIVIQYNTMQCNAI